MRDLPAHSPSDARVSARALQRLVVADEAEGSVLGRPDLGRFVTVPRAGGEFVRALQEHGDVERATARATEVAGEAVDGDDFVDALAGLGLLAEPEADADPLWPRITPRIAHLFFGPVAWTTYAVCTLFAFVAMLASPALRPGYADVWFVEDRALATLLTGVLGISLVGLHEFWHWLAGRAHGLSGGFRVSRRGVFLAFETDLTEVVTMPRRRRNGVYLAGMAVDAVVLALALAVQWAAGAGLPDWAGRLAAAVAFLKVLGIAQQWAMVFLRSDVYALLANLLGCHNLYRATWLTTKRRLGVLSADEAAELGRVSDHDRSVASWFGWVHLAGILAVTAMVAFWVVPYLVGMVRWLAPVIARADLASGQFWTAAALLALTAFTWLTPAFVAVRERRLRREGRLL